MKPKLSTKQQRLLSSLQSVFDPARPIHQPEGSDVDIAPSDLRTAKALERKGYLTLLAPNIEGQPSTKAVLVSQQKLFARKLTGIVMEHRSRALRNRKRALTQIRTYIAELQLAAEALESAEEPDVLTKHLLAVKPRGRIRALRQALEAKIEDFPNAP